MNNSEKITQYSESGILAIAFIGILFISVLSVTSLRPQVKQNTGNVAGINTEMDANDIVFEINSFERNVNINYGKDFNEIKVRVNRLEKGLNEFNIARLINRNDFNTGYVTLGTTINGLVQNQIQVSLFDSLNVYDIYSEQNISSTVGIDLAPSTEKHLTLKIQTDERINFPFEVVLTLL